MERVIGAGAIGLIPVMLNGKNLATGAGDGDWFIPAARVALAFGSPCSAKIGNVFDAGDKGLFKEYYPGLT